MNHVDFFFPWFIFTTLLHLTYVLYHTRHETDTDARGEEKAKSRAQRKEKSQKSSGLQLSNHSPE